MTNPTKSTYTLLAQSDEATVVTEFNSNVSASEQYQTEAELEDEFVSLLERQGYEYLQIRNESELLLNLRRQLEHLNHMTFSDSEWDSFSRNILINPNLSIPEKTKMIQQEPVQVLHRDDGTTKNIKLINKKKIHNNTLQVIRQYENKTGKYENRYDVTILVNGFPMVHCELKRRGVAIREAFNQIDRYQRDSFWASSGLFEYVQIFVISNGTHTKYYSNTTRENRIREVENHRGTGNKTSNSFEFTSYWADANNKPIMDLIDFTRTFFAKRTILNILTRYCVFTSEDMLLVMRPYQIVATERILQRIHIASNYHYDGTIKAGGYIWHTTGSGKTLTSFKTAQLASTMLDIDKVLFVVDRKDLDYQTMKEYDRFEKGAADGNTSTAVLERQLSDLDKDGNPHEYKIIITTIQKLTNFVSRNAKHKVANQKVVLIFDECHRSQFGEMRKKITDYFKHYYLFGFTGTPIFSENANKGANPKYATTPQLFGDKLHTYTIVDAINDENVLPFRIDYVNTISKNEGTDEKIEAIDKEKALNNKERIEQVVKYVLDNYDRKTKRTAVYKVKGKQYKGFNSIFACQSVEMAVLYYKEFRKQITERNSDLTIATIYTFAVNEENEAYSSSGIIDDEELDAGGLDVHSRDALEEAIMDYNLKFHTNFDTSPAKFQNYYKDLSMRTKNREIDILIVVNMFLTGFDATTLNTLWVDKELKMHGLIQAFSRTNRILNSIKTYGNIVCFRNLQNEVDKAISLFGDKNAESIVLLRAYQDYYDGYSEADGKTHTGYRGLIEKLVRDYPVGTMIVGEENEKDFVRVFGGLLRITNILNAFDRFTNEKLLSDRELQDYQSMYIDLYDKWRSKGKQKEDISDDLVFEMELVKQIEINIDYILMMIAKYHKEHNLDSEAVANIVKATESSTQLRSKKELIEAFLDEVNVDSNVEEDWQIFVRKKKEEDLKQLIDEEKLKPDPARVLVDKSLSFGELKTNGTVVDEIMPAVSRFGGSREKKKTTVIGKLKGFFEKYVGII